VGPERVHLGDGRTGDPGPVDLKCGPEPGKSPADDDYVMLVYCRPVHQRNFLLCVHFSIMVDKAYPVPGSGPGLCRSPGSVRGSGGSGIPFYPIAWILSYAIKRKTLWQKGNFPFFSGEGLATGFQVRGRSSPTSPYGFHGRSTPAGEREYPFNPLELMLASEREGLKRIIRAALDHKGFSFVDIFQICASYNDLTEYYNTRVYDWDEKDLEDHDAAYRKAHQIYSIIREK